jgi:hypothetical protein
LYFPKHSRHFFRSNPTTLAGGSLDFNQCNHLLVGGPIIAHLPVTSAFNFSEIPKSGICLCARIGESAVDHPIVAALIDSDIVPAQALYFFSVNRTIAVIFINPFLVAPQHFSFPDFVISPELLPARGAPQH